MLYGKWLVVLAEGEVSLVQFWGPSALGQWTSNDGGPRIIMVSLCCSTLIAINGVLAFCLALCWVPGIQCCYKEDVLGFLLLS